MQNETGAGEDLQQTVQRLVAAGDVNTAATQALLALGPEILRFLRSVLRDEDAAADAFSHFAERLWRGLAGFRGDAPLRTWAYRIAHHSALGLRTDAWHRRGQRFATGEASQIAETIRTKTAVRVERQRTELDRLRQALSADDQALLALRLDRGFSWEEVADVLSAEGQRVQPVTLMKRFERIKKRLTEMVKKGQAGE